MQQIDDLFELAKKSESLHPDLVPHVRKTGHFDMIHHPLLVTTFYVPQLNAMYNRQYEAKKQYVKRMHESGDWSAYVSMFEKLPERITVYRGEPDREQSRPFGRSWTLSRWHAAWFARRFASGEMAGIVWRGTIAKSKVIALLRGRGEWEIVVDRRHVRDVVARRPCEMPRSIGTYPLTKSTGTYHGRSHWWSVLENAETLCARVPDADREVCRAFALLHDGWRLNDDDDPSHGLRAANQIKALKTRLGLSPFQHRKLIEAVARHADGATSRDPTIGVCWDADRLDLPRVGIEPSPKYLSTDVARRSIWAI